MNDRNSKKYSLWITPKDNFRLELQSTINSLANRLNSRVFTPHITVCSDIREYKHDGESSLKELAERYLPISIDTTGINYLNSFYQSLFIEIDENQNLNLLYRSVTELLDLRNLPYYPHISLAYFQPNEALQESLCRNFENGLPKSIEFDSLSIWDTTGQTHQWFCINTFD